jgi:hypothetical protein
VAHACAGTGDSWTPASGDAQLDSLLRLQHAVDTGGILHADWTLEAGQGGGYCSWPHVTCDDAKRVKVRERACLRRLCLKKVRALAWA